jgi:hypothetical protein
MEDPMKVSLNVCETGSTGESRIAMPGVRDSDGAAFDLPRYAELTYQEYSFCSKPKPITDWLCDTLGTCGGDHA